MDLLIWENLNSLGEDAGMIYKTIKLTHFNITVDGFTMFHYFAANPEVMEVIHGMYTLQSEKGSF